jgi:DtxR family Mn-dependent transcriptional regulator
MIKRKTTEEYIETIFVLQNRNGYAKTGKISSEMSVRPSSVTEMLQKLQEEGYIKYEPYKGATLTDSGKKIAHELMKKHKIIADFLEIIGIERGLAEADACQIEHHANKKTMKRLEKFVEFINDAPHEPKWLEHFNYYIQTGKRKQCNFYDEKEGTKKR